MEHVLIIREEANSWGGRGPTVTRHESYEAAHVALADYVARNWESEMPEVCDDDELAELNAQGGPDVYEYFSRVPESYDIAPCPAPKGSAL